MDWQRTNDSAIVEWTDRPTLRDHSQAIEGVALEYMIRLCNRLSVEPWFCMPHAASDDFVRRFAQMVKADLSPALRVHIEYSNECWNGRFAQARYCLGAEYNAASAMVPANPTAFLCAAIR